MIAAALALLAASTLPRGPAPAAQARPPPAGKAPFVLLAEVTGSIDPGSGGFLLEAIEEAESGGAEALVVRLDTPGGLLATTRDVVQAELSARVPIVFWVGPPGARAGSAGLFLTLAANVASMAPATNIGAAHPVGLPGIGGAGKEETGGGGKGGDAGKAQGAAPADDAATMARKVENDTAAFVEGIAQRRSRNVEWAQKAVRESVSVTSARALELKVIDLIAEDLPDLLGKLDGRRVALGPGDLRTLHTAGAELRSLPWPLRSRVLHFLANPEIAYLIGMLGVLGVLAELYHPGTIGPGLAGAICLLVAGIAFQMLPVSGGALALLVLGLVLIGLELTLGGHGGFAVGGTVCVAVGSLLLVGRAPGNGWFADRDYGIGLRVVVPVALALLVIAFTLVTNVRRSARNQLQAGAPGMVGQLGEVREETGAARPGRVLVNGELWSARSAAPLLPGARARVLSVDGLTLEIEGDPRPGGPLS